MHGMGRYTGYPAYASAIVQDLKNTTSALFLVRLLTHTYASAYAAGNRVEFQHFVPEEAADTPGS